MKHLNQDSVRKIIFIIFLTVFAGSASALSCAYTPDTITMHCTERNPCGDPLNITNSERLDLSISKSQIPGPEKSYEIDERLGERETTKYIIKTENNRKLPSAKKALSEAKALCSSGSPLHVYPKSVERQHLEDTTNCYTTEVEELENHYLVWREGNPENWRCVERVRGQMISGGETHYVAPIGFWGLLGKIVDLNIMVDLLIPV